MNRVIPNNLYGIAYWATLFIYILLFVALSSNSRDIANQSKEIVKKEDTRPNWFKNAEAVVSDSVKALIREVF